MRTYLKAYAQNRCRKLDDICVEILEGFLDLRPFDRGLKIHVPMSLRLNDGVGQRWVQLNFFLSDELTLKVDQLCEELSSRPTASGASQYVSRSAVLYTALYWFVKYLRPAQPEQVTNDSGASHD
jgi:hypothetical protein